MKNKTNDIQEEILKELNEVIEDWDNDAVLSQFDSTLGVEMRLELLNTIYPIIKETFEKGKLQARKEELEFIKKIDRKYCFEVLLEERIKLIEGEK